MTTVCGTFQLLVVNVRVAPELTLKMAEPLVKAVVTGVVFVGCADRRPVRLLVPPSAPLRPLALRRILCEFKPSCVAVTVELVQPVALTVKTATSLTALESAAAAITTACGT